ncbi:hypothetical protein IFM89_018900 [Coptis chinensis]|uniref:CCHC-type domain-containing protein n=1 Tax=Coptis chinensis TaxID=261450 RepID=A0A835HFH4_9MAGN|nr:hypothetical protein IFM89_018900 [Coptis chinensis]
MSSRGRGGVSRAGRTAHLSDIGTNVPVGPAPAHVPAGPAPAQPTPAANDNRPIWEHRRPKDYPKTESSDKGKRVYNKYDSQQQYIQKKQRIGSSSKPFFGRCHRCDRYGHKLEDCNMPEKLTGFFGNCYRCSKFGHKSDDCRVPEKYIG